MDRLSLTRAMTLIFIGKVPTVKTFLDKGYNFDFHRKMFPRSINNFRIFEYLLLLPSLLLLLLNHFHIFDHLLLIFALLSIWIFALLSICCSSFFPLSSSSSSYYRLILSNFRIFGYLPSALLLLLLLS
ncbi:uncharacterized protein F5147DRAFT_759643 [Suillus discolor]|uniref:Uncharacterized protein n=1 Tax=Suillus discolor TaxID=1912936 RepID=A0A9P7FAU0_9AGAM|nr:uncharacterized protein F5147DRAFT_759643 [Suillus discolor]KAG2112349.1 hypothetical protein F5147DRAFT_759643 [Suillus discolor]